MQVTAAIRTWPLPALPPSPQCTVPVTSNVLSTLERVVLTAQKAAFHASVGALLSLSD